MQSQGPNKGLVHTSHVLQTCDPPTHHSIFKVPGQTLVQRVNPTSTLKVETPKRGDPPPKKNPSELCLALESVPFQSSIPPHPVLSSAAPLHFGTECGAWRSHSATLWIIWHFPDSGLGQSRGGGGAGMWPVYDLSASTWLVRKSFQGPGR